MRITYLFQYFNTPSMFGSLRGYEMARRFVSWGHEVHMITSDRDSRAPQHKSWYETNEAGINVHWLPVPYSNYMSNMDRIRSFYRFAFGAARKAASLNSDVIFATSTPLTIAIPAVYATRKTKRPMVFEVRDLWPEAPIQMGALKSPPLIAGAERLERLAYQHASHVIALSPGMRDGVVAKGVPASRVTVVPNSSDLEFFKPDTDGSAFRQKLGTTGKFVLIYFGAMGEANGLDFVLDAAGELKRRHRDDIVFVLHGDGKERPRLEARREAEGLDNVIITPEDLHKTLSKEGLGLAQLVASADVAMTIYKNVPILYTCSPNKMFDSLAAGKPVLVNMPGWLQDVVEKNRAGVFVQPDNVLDFADKVVYLRDHPELCAEFANNARQLAENVFSRDKLAREVEAVLKRAVEGS